MNINPQLFSVKPLGFIKSKLAFFAADLLTICSLVFEFLGSFRLPDFVWFRPAAVAVAIETDRR